MSKLDFLSGSILCHVYVQQPPCVWDRWAVLNPSQFFHGMAAIDYGYSARDKSIAPKLLHNTGGRRFFVGGVISLEGVINANNSETR